MNRSGVVIKRTREAAGLSQQALAEKIGLATNASISNLERGVQTLTVDTAWRIADACGMPRATFMQEITSEPDHDTA